MNAVSRITWPRSSFVGFDRIWNELDTALTAGVEQTNAFPRHNVVKVDEENFHIELALAGYSRDNLSVELKDGLLVIAGEKGTTKKSSIFTRESLPRSSNEPSDSTRTL